MKDNTISVDTTTTTSAYSGLRRGALIGYRWGLLAFLLLGVVQIFLAGVGIFGLDGQELGAESETAFNPHRSLGFGLGGLALIILILALIARPGARSIVLAVVMFLLAFLAQSLLAAIGEDTPVVGGLHALDGLAILGIAGFLYWSSRRSVTS